jgi:hypothetical protein
MRYYAAPSREFNQLGVRDIQGENVRFGFLGESGVNVGDDLCKAFEPVTMSLGRHFQRQNDSAACTLIPALEWLQSSSRLSGFGTKLLSELKETQAQGTSPRPLE